MPLKSWKTLLDDSQPEPKHPAPPTPPRTPPRPERQPRYEEVDRVALPEGLCALYLRRVP